MTKAQLSTEQLSIKSQLEETNSISSNMKVDENQIVQYAEIKGTPFTMVKQNDRFAIAIGRYVISDTRETLQEAEEMLEKNKWDIIINLMMVMNKAIEETNKKQGGN